MQLNWWRYLIWCTQNFIITRNEQNIKGFENSTKNHMIKGLKKQIWNITNEIREMETSQDTRI